MLKDDNSPFVAIASPKKANACFFVRSGLLLSTPKVWLPRCAMGSVNFTKIDFGRETDNTFLGSAIASMVDARMIDFVSSLDEECASSVIGCRTAILRPETVF